MAEDKAVQNLIAARTEIQRDAFNSRDVDKMMSVVSKDIHFTDEDFGMVNLDYSAVQEFYKGIFSTMSPFKVLSSTSTGTTPDFSVWELTTEGVALEDLPSLKAKAGDTVRLLGVSLIWWRWEGKSEWKNGLSKDGIMGWKIVKQRDYFIPKVNPSS